MCDDIKDLLWDMLGGNRFAAVTGSHDFVWDQDKLSLTFRLSARAQEKAKANSIKITYNQLKDTYTMQLINVKSLKNQKLVKSVTDNYFGMLRDLFEKWTGLNNFLNNIML